MRFFSAHSLTVSFDAGRKISANRSWRRSSHASNAVGCVSIRSSDAVAAMPDLAEVSAYPLHDLLEELHSLRDRNAGELGELWGVARGGVSEAGVDLLEWFADQALDVANVDQLAPTLGKS